MISSRDQKRLDLFLSNSLSLCATAKIPLNTLFDWYCLGWKGSEQCGVLSSPHPFLVQLLDNANEVLLPSSRVANPTVSWAGTAEWQATKAKGQWGASLKTGRGSSDCNFVDDDGVNPSHSDVKSVENKVHYLLECFTIQSRPAFEEATELVRTSESTSTTVNTFQERTSGSSSSLLPDTEELVSQLVVGEILPLYSSEDLQMNGPVGINFTGLSAGVLGTHRVVFG